MKSLKKDVYSYITDCWLSIYMYMLNFFVFMNIQSCHILIASSTFSCNWMKVHQSVNLVKISAYICINKQLLVFQKVVWYLFSNFQKLIRILPFQWWIKNIQKNYSDRGMQNRHLVFDNYPKSSMYLGLLDLPFCTCCLLGIRRHYLNWGNWKNYLPRKCFGYNKTFKDFYRVFCVQLKC